MANQRCGMRFYEAMSGQLVGEVIAASDDLRVVHGLSERGFHARVAIAEKAHTDTRQGSVRWDHIRAGLYGVSKRTAERAVQDLKTAGLLKVVRPGFDNGRGRACAPIYEIRPLTDPVTQVSRTVQADTDTQVSRPVSNDAAKTGTDTDTFGGRSRHPGVVLDGPIDGSIERAAIRAAIDKCPACDEYGRDTYDFTLDCPRHPNFRSRAAS